MQPHRAAIRHAEIPLHASFRRVLSRPPGRRPSRFLHWDADPVQRNADGMRILRHFHRIDQHVLDVLVVRKPQGLPPRAPPTRNWRANTAAVQTPLPTLALPAKCPAAPRAPSPVPYGATTRRPLPLPAGSPRPPLCRLAAPHPVPTVDITTVLRTPNLPWCGRPPRTVLPACNVSLQSPPPERQCRASGISLNLVSAFFGFLFP